MQILIVESIRSLATHRPEDDDDKLHVPSLIAVGIALATKFSLFCYCYAIKSSSSQVQVLWEDHRNDLPVNAMGILTSAAGAKLAWWIDPAGAILIACGVNFAWIRTVSEQFTLLAGRSAETNVLNYITYKVRPVTLARSAASETDADRLPCSEYDVFASDPSHRLGQDLCKRRGCGRPTPTLIAPR